MISGSVVNQMLNGVMDIVLKTHSLELLDSRMEML
jgi:hypothetical protein